VYDSGDEPEIDVVLLNIFICVWHKNIFCSCVFIVIKLRIVCCCDV